MSPPPRDPWSAAWRLATSDVTLAALLLGVTAGLLVAGWLPQMPSPTAPADYAQWLSEAQARFGPTTDFLRTLGLFSITRSLPFRLLLSLLAGCLLLRLVEESSDLRQGFTWGQLFSALTSGGGLVLLVGLLIAHLWGWRVEGIALQSGGRVFLSDGGKWVARSSEDGALSHSPGILAVTEGEGPGVRVSATDDGRELLLHLPDGDPATELTIPLTEDRYFAIPEARLVVRLSPRSQDTATGQVLVQVYHSPSGLLTAEAAIGDDTTLAVDGVTLRFVCSPYIRLTAVFNPGLWPEIAGLLLLTVGTTGGTLWPRFHRRATVEASSEEPPEEDGRQ